MKSSILSYDDELLNNAYANISLIADEVWALDHEDSFRKLNQKLWVQKCKIIAKQQKSASNRPKRVRDVIPNSRLASYGNYEYDEVREQMYSPDETTPTRQKKFHASEISEPWMLDEVEEYFTRLTQQDLLPDDELSTKDLRSYDVSMKDEIEQLMEYQKCNFSIQPNEDTNEQDEITENVDEEFAKCTPLRFSINTALEAQLQRRIFSASVREIWSNSVMQQQYIARGLRQHQTDIRKDYSLLYHPKQPKLPNLQSNQEIQQIHYNFQNERLMYRSRYQTPYVQTMGLAQRAFMSPMLSPEVPEFFPKAPTTWFNEEHPVPVQYFPSSTENSYQDELFPYNRRHVAISEAAVYQQNTIMPMIPAPNMNTVIRQQQPWIHRIVPPLQIQIPVCSVMPQPICTTIQPICPTIIQRPIPLQEKILTQSQGNSAPIPVYQRPIELYQENPQRRKSQGVDFNNLILLTKSAMKARRNQSKNPRQSSSFILESRQPNLKSESDVLRWLDKGYPKRAKDFMTVNSLVSEFQSFESKCETVKEVSSDFIRIDQSPQTSKTTEDDAESEAPLKKRLYRDVLTNSSSTGVSFENAFEKNYDELERQAMEQYRTSEECLALRYQV